MRSISARNFSRRVRFFFIAYSELAKLRWLMVIGLLSSGVRSSTLRELVKRTARRINQHLPKLIWLALRNITADWGRATKEWREAMNQFAIAYGDRFTKVAA